MPPPRRALCACLLLAGAVACHRNNVRETDAEPPIPVAAEGVRLGNIKGVVSATAVVEALPGADFAAIAPEPGRIVEVTRATGDKVNAGDVLVRFEFPELRAEGAVRAAAARHADVRLRGARTMQARVRTLLERGAASQQELEAADREVTEAEAEVAQGRAAQAAADAIGQHTTIRAPFGGVVAERLHNPGDVVGTSAADVILRVIDLRQVEVMASVAAADATRFTVGASARGVTASRLTPEILRVTSRPALEPGAAAVSVRLAFVEATELTPGTQLGVEIDAEQHSNVNLVPSISVVKDGSGFAVFVVAGNEVRKRTVEPGLSDGERMEIRAGLKAGELVVTQGQSNLRDGSAITLGR